MVAPLWSWPPGSHVQLRFGLTKVTAEGNSLLQVMASIFNFLNIRTVLGHTCSVFVCFELGLLSSASWPHIRHDPLALLSQVL